MDRNSIIRDCPDEFKDKLKEFVDEMESAFNEIRDNLKDLPYDMPDKIKESYILAFQMSQELY